MKKTIFICLLLVVIGIGLLHFFTPGHQVFYHDTYRRLSYFPIVLGALWFGVWGGFSLAVLSSIFFIPHLLLYIGGPPATYLSELTEVVLYLAAGTVTGIIASKEARLREGYRIISEKLEKSYARLHKETELLLEAEEQLGASQKLSALGQLSASLAHEIKNPLSSIRGTAEILLDEFPVGHPKREFVEILLKEATRLNSTVEDVLQYSKGMPANTGNGSSATALALCIEQVAKLLEGEMKKKSIGLIIPESPLVEDFPVDGDKLSQVFLNIILNAIDALPDGGEITFRFHEEDEGAISVFISDNGAGIPAIDRDKIFTAFYTAKEDGTGLGLAISRKIVESYGGTLTLEECEEAGACFRVFLPRTYPGPPLEVVDL